MNARYPHSTLKLRFVLIAVLACALAGCWEEIHYTAPPAGSEAATATQPRAVEEAENFANDVANQLEAPEPLPGETAGETASAVGEPPTDATTSTPVALPTEPIPTERAPTEPPVAESTPSAPAPETPSANPSRSPRRIAWLLGSNLSLAALANDRAADEAKVADWFDKARRLAALLNITIADLPPRPAAGESDATATRAMDYLFDQGQSIGRHLATQFGDDHAALFELALKSNILLVRYHPEAPVVKSLSAAISQSGERANLPPEQYQPLLKLLDENAPVKDVRNAVFDMHALVDRYLSTEEPAATP